MIKNSFSKNKIFCYSFLLAFCSFFYELSLAQLLSTLLGGTYLQYAITIGLFTFSLGLGSLYYGKAKKKKQIPLLFIRAEFFLIAVVILSPFFMIILSKTTFWFLIYLPILLIGISTGIELPFLIDQDEESLSKTLAADYLGMIFSSVLFPLFFFPIVGLVPSLLLVCTINIFIVSFLLTNKSHRLLLTLLITVFLTLIILNINQLNSLSSKLLEIHYAK